MIPHIRDSQITQLHPSTVTREFEIQHCVGRGGFGEVHRARMISSSGLSLEVALKLLHPDIAINDEAVQRLRDEGKLLSKLDHPAILKVVDLIQLEDRMGLVTEFITGQDLGDCFHGRHAIPIRALLQVIAEVASALDAAWSTPNENGSPLHLLHRDIKPSNIRIGPHGSVKLLDFGIARADTEREARTSALGTLGTWQYMAPERLFCPEVDPTSDVFALGCVLFEGVAGERFYADQNQITVMGLSAIQDKYESFLQNRMESLAYCGVDPRVLELVRRCMEYSPQRRPSAMELFRRCDALADRIVGLSLRQWCEARTWSEENHIASPLTGQVLTEKLCPLPPPLYVSESVPPRRLKPALFALGGLAAVSCLTLGSLSAVTSAMVLGADFGQTSESEPQNEEPKGIQPEEALRQPNPGPQNPRLKQTHPLPKGKPKEGLKTPQVAAPNRGMPRKTQRSGPPPESKPNPGHSGRRKGPPLKPKPKPLSRPADETPSNPAFIAPEGNSDDDDDDDLKWLRISSNPEGIVYINDDREGRTPQNMRLRPATYKVAVEAFGYERYEASVDLELDTKIHATLTPLRGEVAVKVHFPRNSRLIVDDQPFSDRSPIQMTLSIGRHDFYIIYNSGSEGHVTRDVVPTQSGPFIINLTE